MLHIFMFHVKISVVFIMSYDKGQFMSEVLFVFLSYNLLFLFLRETQFSNKLSTPFITL